jgi:Fic family protein
VSFCPFPRIFDLILYFAILYTDFLDFKMDRDYIIKVVLAVYRVTDVFPDKEPLKNLIREKANQILADLILEAEKEETNKNVNLIRSYFEVAKGQGWLDETNFLVLEKEYNKISEILKEDKEVKKKEVKKEEVKKEKREEVKETVKTKEEKKENGELTKRARKILEILKEKEKIQVWELKRIFPDLTKRTLRRDFDSLLRLGLVERRGAHNNVYYILSDRVRT